MVYEFFLKNIYTDQSHVPNVLNVQHTENTNGYFEKQNVRKRPCHVRKFHEHCLWLYCIKQVNQLSMQTIFL